MYFCLKEPQINGESSCSQAREHELMGKGGNKRHEIGLGLNWDEDEFAISIFFYYKCLHALKFIIVLNLY